MQATDHPIRRLTGRLKVMVDLDLMKVDFSGYMTVGYDITFVHELVHMVSDKRCRRIGESERFINDSGLRPYDPIASRMRN